MGLLGRKSIVYGAFKGIGDFICAAPVIASELDSGADVNVLVYPQVVEFIKLLEFGPNAKNLHAYVLPARGTTQSAREFFRHMSRLSPELICVSPHAPRAIASWKIPLLLWVLKRRYWPKALLAGAASEPLSGLFNVRVPVNRSLPYMVREWTAYSGLQNHDRTTSMPQVIFRDSIQRSRELPRLFDIVIHPGAGTENRKWPLERYVELVQQISDDCRIAVVGLTRDVAALQAVLPAGRGISFLTGSLENAIISIARARVAMTMDSGSMYFAHLLGVPTVSLFGPSDPENVVPVGWNVSTIYEQKWSCQPCKMPRCRQKMVFCMNSLEPRRVASQILNLLRQSG